MNEKKKYEEMDAMELYNEYSKIQDKLTDHRKATGGEKLLNRILFFMFIWTTIGSVLITVIIFKVNTVSSSLANVVGTVLWLGWVYLYFVRPLVLRYKIWKIRKIMEKT